MDWKNKLERTIGINTAIVKAEQQNFINKKVIEDLELKNKTLHKCAYATHSRISELLNTSEEAWDELCFFTELTNIKNKMEEILSARDDSEQALENINNAKSIITD